jgi:hypothetical protein
MNEATTTMEPTSIEPSDVPLERLESEICKLAAHISAATCRWLGMVAEFDRREGWAGWGCRSCAHWLNWRCGLAIRAGQEHVRVARSLEGLSHITAAFARGELSYSKVRALTRIATPESEEDLVTMAAHATAAHLEKLVRAYRRATRPDDLEEANSRHAERHLTWHWDDDGSLVVQGRLSPEDGALVIKALEAAADMRSAERMGGSPDSSGSKEGADGWGARNADALVAMAETLLAAGPTPQSGGDRYQVVVHADAETLGDDTPGVGGRCELDDGPTIAAETARRLICDASVVAMLESDGEPLNVGRKTRSIPPALRRALRSRDGGCRFPACTNRRFVDGHHVQHWAHGGETSLANLVELCRAHHRLVHEGGFGLERDADGGFTFRRPDGRFIPAAPPANVVCDGDEVVPRNRHLGLNINERTGVPAWGGERLDYGLALDNLLGRAGLLDCPGGHTTSSQQSHRCRAVPVILRGIVIR